MNDTHSNKSDGQVAQGERPESADELVEAARAYFSLDFPNAERTGCPPAKTLQAVAPSSSLPSDELRAHLFTCSECFREYREALAFETAHVPARRVIRFGGLTFSARLGFAFAAAIALVALSVLVMITLRHRTPSPAPPVAEHDGEAPSPSNQQTPNDSKQPERLLPGVTENGRRQTARSEEPNANQNTVAQLSSNYREIDLEAYTLYRGASDQSGSASKPTQLKASLNQLLFRLPDASPRGRYRVMVKNSRMDQTIVSSEAYSPNGKTLKATLDLRKLEPARYVLCLSPEGHAPFCYEVVVTH